MIGIKFKTKNEYGNYFYKIFSSTNLLDYIWNITEDSVLLCKDNELIDSIFNKENLLGKEFLDCIIQEQYYIIFANIKAFLANDDNLQEINTYEDFIKSSCQFILLCFDTIYFEFYCKNERMLEQVKDACERHMFEDITCITSENITRTKMRIW